MTDEANIAEAELANIVCDALGVHRFWHNDAITGKHCVTCELTFAECLSNNSRLRFEADKVARALLAAGYAKRSDVVEECWLKALGDETNSAIPLELATNKDAMKGIEFITMQIANSIRSLKGQP